MDKHTLAAGISFLICMMVLVVTWIIWEKEGDDRGAAEGNRVSLDTL